MSRCLFAVRAMRLSIFQEDKCLQTVRKTAGSGFTSINTNSAPFLRKNPASSHGFNLQMEFLSQDWSAEALWPLKAPLTHVNVTGCFAFRKRPFRAPECTVQSPDEDSLGQIFLYPTGDFFLVGNVLKKERNANGHFHVTVFCSVQCIPVLPN